MINIVRKIWQIPLILLLALGLGGCASQSDEPSGGSQMWDGDLCLLLNVNVINGEGSATRAEEVSDTYPTEQLHTLRIIIVNQTETLLKRRVVHNRYWSNPDDVPEKIKFKVEFDTRYKIYLIANEKGIPGYENSLKDILNTKLAPGNLYTENILEYMVISASEPGQPIINNSSEEDPVNIPMTESYEITTDKKPSSLDKYEIDGDNDMIIKTRKLFITRAASKFSFYFYKKGNTDNTDNTDYWENNDLKLSKIIIKGLGESEYLFPYQTLYSPSLNDENSLEKHITTFVLPGEGSTTGPKNNTGDYTFELPDPIPIGTLEDRPDDITLDVLKNYPKPFSPQIYFPESKGKDNSGDFQCAIVLEGENGDEFFAPLKLPNLPSLPRNTHVKVVISINMHTYEIEATVTLVPYIGVTLDPVFGSDDLVPKDDNNDNPN